MGPFRRRLIIAFALSPSTALAEVCDKVRPRWTGETVTSLSEAVWLFSSVPAIALLLATALALRFRSAWGGVAVVVGWTVLVSLIVMKDPSGLQNEARIEGCVGPASLFIVVATAICILTILYTAPRKTRSDERID